jgi:hypothetical protein
MADANGVPTPAEKRCWRISRATSWPTTQEPVVSDLASYVTQSATARPQSRRLAEGVDEQIAAGLRAVKRQLSPGERAAAERLGGGRLRLRSTAASRTPRSAAAGRGCWTSLANAKDRPYTIAPTPIPDLPPDAEDAIVNRLEQDVVAQLGPDPTEVPPDIEAARSAAQEQRRSSARRSWRRQRPSASSFGCTIRIAQSGWHKAFEEFALDIMMYPAAIMKGPYHGGDAAAGVGQGQAGRRGQARVPHQPSRPDRLLPRAEQVVRHRGRAHVGVGPDRRTAGAERRRQGGRRQPAGPSTRSAACQQGADRGAGRRSRRR